MARDYLAGFPADDRLYHILQVSPGARAEVIQAAYRVLARIYHPDVSAAPDADEQTRRLNAAYDVLSDPVQRASYDALRAEAGRIAASRSSSFNSTRSARSAAVGRVQPAGRPTGSMVLAWAVTSCVALVIVAAMLLILWSLFESFDAPNGSVRAPNGSLSAPLQPPVAPPFGNTTWNWSR
jgi:curved DNA-binding protein CbpA